MILRRSPKGHRSLHPVSSTAVLGITLLVLGIGLPAHAAPNYPITQGQRSTASQVAQAGVPLSELAPDAPDRYTVKRGDTLWDISSLFLRSPWHWPELWGMNMDQVRNPHLIFPGQVLVLVRSGDRARLQFGDALDADQTGRLSPRGRATDLDLGAISSIPLHLIQPFLNDAVVLDTNQLDTAPRIVAGRDARVLLGRGDTAYVRGELAERREWRIFREARPLKDPGTGELLGYEAAFVGTAEYVRRGQVKRVAEDRDEITPATFTLTMLRQEAGRGDRLAPAGPSDDGPYTPHAPTQAVDGQVVSIYGGSLAAGPNQIVAINKGRRDGMERGHVLGVVRTGQRITDRSDPLQTQIKLPDERNGNLFVFRVFERVSYALILSAQTPVVAGDHVIQP
jgi:hypothetical protein